MGKWNENKQNFDKKITENLESDPWSGISQLKKWGRVSVRDSQWDQMRRGALRRGNKQSKLKIELK